MKIKTLLYACALPLITWHMNAQSPVTVYSGTSHPTEQGWVEQKLNATVNDLAAPTAATVADGVLKLTSTNAANQFSQLGWYKTNLDLDLSTGFAIEIKAKVISADKTGAFNIQGYDKSGKGFRVGILTDGITEQTNPFAATNILATGLVNDDGFHTYRISFTTLGVAVVFRNGVLLGTFPLTTFQYDNIIENGGFEDEGFPDFISNGSLTRVTDPKLKRYGNYALEMNSNGLVTNDWLNIEGARTREIAVKPDTEYEMSITRRRTASEPWSWRDMGAFYDFNKGCLGLKGENVDGRNEAGRPMFASVNDRHWQVHNQSFTTPSTAKTIRFEFPTWIRDNDKKSVTSSFDNFTLREKPVQRVLPNLTPASFILGPTFHEGYVNLIANGGFEDHTINNDGTPYEWALASNGGENDNTPTNFNPMWNGEVRIQNQHKPDDFNVGDEFYARSGTSSLRFSTLNMDGQGKNRNFNFTVELEANKTYRFSFWHRNPRWNDFGWLLVRVGEANPIWGHRTGSRANKWIPVDMVFTTTDVNKTLHLYTISDAHGDWWNQYIDDMVLYEIPENTPLDPQIEGKTNLIANGDFEDVTMNNDGTSYEWALATDYESNNDNFPMAYNEMWGTWVRIQDKEKRGNDYWGDQDDTGYDWARSGSKSLRFTFQDNWDQARDFEGLSGDVQPDAFQLNMNFKKELEPNKTYTFVFWIKTSCWDDRGWIHVANGDVKVLSHELTNRFMNWSRQSVTFSTTSSNHTLRMFTEFRGWMNIYLDDLFLFEEEVYVPAEFDGQSYLAFGKSTGTSSTDVEIEYIKLDNTGAYINTVVFVSNGGTEVATQVVNGVLPQPQHPVKEGYVFGGWYTDMMLTSAYNFNSTVTQDMILYAKWNDISTGSILPELSNEVFHCYPNPIVDGRLTISNIQSAASRIEIYNIVGAHAGSFDVKGTTTAIDLSHFAAGTYIVKIDGVAVKIMKQ
jgi:uncharacterized repeat protein (TIGR02543 family)